MSRITLLTSQEAFEALHEVADGRKHQARVDREALLHLLIDHSTMLAALQSSTSFRVIEPPKAGRERPRLRG